MKRNRLITGTIGLVLLVSFAVALNHGAQLVGIGAGYKAKMLCSEVFVAGRDVKEVAVDLEIDDLEVLRVIKGRLDREAKTSTASFLGLVKRTAQYRDDRGCSLIFNSSDESKLGRVPRAAGQDGAGTPASPTAPEDLPTELNLLVEDAIAEAFEEPNPAHLRRTRAIVVVHKGRVVAERYAPGLGHDTPLPGWSMTKSVLSALVGALAHEHAISLDASVPIAQWQDPGDPRASISLRHLLHMSSGLRFDEDMANPLADVTRMLLAERDMAAFAASKDLMAAPGTRWQYSSGSSNIVSLALRNILGEDEYRSFPRAALFDRLGMPNALIETDASGTFVGSSFMYATAREWARFGMLYLQDGIWENERILPEGWVVFTTTPAPADPQAKYGAHFWLSVPDEYNTSGASLPPDVFHAVGHEGQFVTIAPSRNAVIVRLGKTRYANAWDHGAFVQTVLRALEASGKQDVVFSYQERS